MVVFLLLLIAAIVLVVLGSVLNGLFYLLIIGVVLFALDLVYLGARIGASGRRTTR